jgi:Tfp pilus tip-associated adhesin PilY1
MNAISRLWRLGRSRRTLAVALALALSALPSNAPALVNPVTLIQQQIIKPNMLIVFDTSSSMIDSPGNKDLDENEVGMDCDNGDNQCRMVGAAGRCYFSGGGAMGSGTVRDRTPCTADAQCRKGYCKSSTPTGCAVDSDCSSGNTCIKRCSNNTATSCTTDSNCGAGNICGKLCSNDTSGALCAVDSDCPGDDYCSVFPNDTCTLTAAVTVSKICVAGQNRCKVDSDCTAVAGDTCGPASSRLVVEKRVVANIVSQFYTTVNFGLMTFYQTNYYPYFPVSGAITNTTVARFASKDELAAQSCWTKTTGPSATCSINGQTYTKSAGLNSSYRVKTGGKTFTDVDANWCGTATTTGVWCPVTGGTGYYRGSYYTYSNPTATLSSTTPLIRTSYQGQTITVSGTNYVYWNPPMEMRNIGNLYGLSSSAAEPIDAGIDDGSGSTNALPCSTQAGGRADLTVAPFMDTTNDPVKATAMAKAILAKMDKTGLGGLASEGFTPTGCTLAYDSASTHASTSNNAQTYMKAVIAADTTACRNNYVLLVTDGSPNRGYDVNCDDPKCAAADPTAAGCTCWAVKAAQKLYNGGVAPTISTYVVGFSATLTGSYPTATLNNMAKAGGTKTAYFASNELDLYNSMASAIYDAAKAQYSTSPATASSGVQQTNSVTVGTMLLDTRVDFPGWRGEVVAYETSTGVPLPAWSAATVAFDYRLTGAYAGKYFQPADAANGYATDRSGDWKKRNVWTSSGTTMIKIDVNQTTGAINNALALSGLGLGANAAEADRVGRWMLGDPSMANPAVLGAVINSTPIDVGPPGSSPLPGGLAFYTANVTRPNLTYVGASDGMLHAFFTKDVTVGGTAYRAGQEAFAYMPQTFLAVASKLFAQSGQLPDPKDHIYGLANSPKAKSLCTSNCAGTGTPVWKTVLAMAYGFGGTEAFVVDITNPFNSTGVRSATTDPPASLLWNTQYLAASTSSAYDNDLGLTTSVPAFYYGKSATRDDFRLIFGSYTTGSDVSTMAKVVINASIRDGSLIDADTVTPPNSGCVQAFGLLTDVAVARNFSATEETQIFASYFGDTFGNLYRYVPVVGSSNYTGTAGTVTSVLNLGCTMPIHYVPAVVQLDRDNPTNRPGEIYLVQVTNSGLDTDTKGFVPSQMIITRDLATSAGTVAKDTTWTNIVLKADGSGTGLCGVTNAAGTSCTTRLPAGTVAGGVYSGLARPNATPLVVLRQDGLGFDVISTWYLPPVNGCTDGVTYLNIYQVNVDGTYVLKFAQALASEPITSTVFVGGKLMFAAQGGVTDLSSSLPTGLSFITGSAATGPGAGTPDRFRKLGWNELP